MQLFMGKSRSTSSYVQSEPWNMLQKGRYSFLKEAFLLWTRMLLVVYGNNNRPQLQCLLSSNVVNKDCWSQESEQNKP